MQTIRTELLLGNKKVVVGDKYTDLVLETLGKIYIKTGNKSQVLDLLISNLIENADKPKTIIVNNELEMNNMNYPGDGAFVYNKLTNSLYMALDSRYVLILQVQTDENPMYVSKDGDTMSGPLEIATVSAPLIIHSSLLVENLNAEYLNSYSSNDFAKKKIDEVIYGSWTFDSLCQSNNNWIFKENTRFYKDVVTSGSLSSPEFAGGFGGYGWRLDANTNTLTIDNLVVRKAMQVYEMVINLISATNGSLWVSNSTKVEKVYRPYLIAKEELDVINTGTREEITAKLNKVLWNDSYFLITDLGLTINQDTNNLGVSEEENIGKVTETKSLSSANYINITPKEFVNFKYVIWIGDLNKLMEDTTFPGIEALYDENYLFNVNTNLELKAFYLSKEIQVTEWNEDNTPKVSQYLSTFNKNTEIYIVPRDSEEVVGLKPYYKYFAVSRDLINAALSSHINDEVKKVPVPTIYIIESDSEMNPTLKSGDIVRCQKFEENNIKYYDAIVTAQFKSRGYFLLKAASVFDTYTEITYNDNGEVESRTEVNNSTLYNKTEKTYNADTGEYEDNYSTTETVADVAADDDIVQMGNIYNTQRQNAIYITSTDDLGPYIDIMSGLNRPDYSVIYDQPVYKQIKVFIKLKGDIFVQGEPYSYYYLKENPGAINFNQKPAYITSNTKKYPLVYVTTDEDLNVTNLYINNGEVNTIPSDTSQGFFITNYPTLYSIKDLNEETSEYKVTGTKITKVRLGNLDGIYNVTFGNKQPYGFGLYGENVFLTGEFYLNNGKSVVDVSKDYINLEIGNLEDGLSSTGINIQDRTITITSDKLIILSNSGTTLPEGSIGNILNGINNDINKAQDAADEAAKNAEIANNDLTNFKSDNIISPTEKTALRQLLADIDSEYNLIISDANKYDVATDEYTAAYNAARAALVYYTSTDEDFIDIKSDYDNISAYYTARQIILDTIATKAKEYADSVGSNSLLLARDNMAKLLGYGSYNNMVEQVSEFGSVIIKGGYLNANLIEAGAITADMIAANAILVDEVYNLAEYDTTALTKEYKSVELSLFTTMINYLFTTQNIDTSIFYAPRYLATNSIAISFSDKPNFCKLSIINESAVTKRGVISVATPKILASKYSEILVTLTTANTTLLKLVSIMGVYSNSESPLISTSLKTEGLKKIYTIDATKYSDKEFYILIDCDVYEDSSYVCDVEFSFKYSDDYPSYNWALLKDGSGQLALGNIKWDINGNLSIVGNITSRSGYIGGFYINSENLLAHSSTGRLILSSNELEFTNWNSTVSLSPNSYGICKIQSSDVPGIYITTNYSFPAMILEGFSVTRGDIAKSVTTVKVTTSNSFEGDIVETTVDLANYPVSSVYDILWSFGAWTSLKILLPKISDVIKAIGQSLLDSTLGSTSFIFSIEFVVGYNNSYNNGTAYTKGFSGYLGVTFANDSSRLPGSFPTLTELGRPNAKYLKFYYIYSNGSIYPYGGDIEETITNRWAR